MISGLRNALLLVDALGAQNPEEHVLPHGLFRISSSNLHLPLFQDQAHEFWMTNHLLMLLVAAVLTFLVFFAIGRRYQVALAGVPVENTVPRGFTSLIETVMDGLRSRVVRPVLAGKTDQFMPFLWTVFFFILFCNLLGMLPLDGIFKLLFGIAHIGGTPTGNINVTAGLALCAFAMIHVAGLRELFGAMRSGTFGHHGHHDDDHGHHDVTDRAVSNASGVSAASAAMWSSVIYVWNFAPHAFAVTRHRAKPGVLARMVMLVFYTALLFVEWRMLGMLFGGVELAGVFQWVGLPLGIAFAFNAGGLHPLDFADCLMWGFLVLLEAIGALVKPFALCVRLFANMVAGHTVLAALLALIPIFKGLSAGFLLGASAPVIGSVLLSCLELFVAFLQAFIFMFLTTMFIDAAVNPQH